MIARVPGAFGSRQRPVILDVSQLVRRVVWGSSDLWAVMLYRWTYSGTVANDYPIFLRELPFGSSWNLNTGFNQLIPNVNPTPIVESKISNEQRARMLLWTYEPNKLATSETSTITTEVIDLAHYVGYVSGGFPLFGGDFATAEQAYESFTVGFIQLFGRPPDPLDPNDMYVGATSIIESHSETTTITRHHKSLAGMLFLNLSLIALKYLPPPDKKPKLSFEISLGPGTSKEGISWAIDLFTFRNKREFPPKRYLSGPDDAKVARMDPMPTWPAPVHSATGFDKIGGGDFPPMAARTLTFGIDCVTLKITQATLAPP